MKVFANELLSADSRFKDHNNQQEGRYTMKKMILLLAAAFMAIGVLAGAPAMAGGVGNYTGWSIDGGAPRFYINGNIFANGWVLYGKTLYWVGADGYILPNRVMSDDVLREFPVQYLDTNGFPVVREAAWVAARQIPATP